MYNFDQAVSSSIQSQWKEACVESERYVCYEQNKIKFERHHLLLRFKTPIYWQHDFSNVTHNIESILADDKALCAKYAALFSDDHLTIKTALRWKGRKSPTHFRLDGFGLTIVSAANHAWTMTSNAFFSPFIAAGLLLSEDADSLFLKLKACLSQKKTHALTNRPVTFFHQKKVSLPAQTVNALLAQGVDRIKQTIQPIPRAEKAYAGENAVNPAYENLNQLTRPLPLDENHIWLLTSQFELVLGIKNAYQESFGYYGFIDGFETESYDYLPWDDRAGHPSLVYPDVGHPGGAYLAGHLMRRGDRLEVLNSSGRFERHDLNHTQVELLESYLALRFMQAFGVRQVVFISSQFVRDGDYYELSRFCQNKSLLNEGAQAVSRDYDFAKIKAVLGDEARLNDQWREGKFSAHVRRLSAH